MDCKILKLLLKKPHRAWRKAPAAELHLNFIIRKERSHARKISEKALCVLTKTQRHYLCQGLLPINAELLPYRTIVTREKALHVACQPHKLLVVLPVLYASLLNRGQGQFTYHHRGLQQSSLLTDMQPEFEPPAITVRCYTVETESTPDVLIESGRASP